MNTEKKSSVDILFDFAIKTLKDQISRIDGTDTKIGVIFGLTNALAAALGGFVFVCRDTISWPVFISIALSVVLYVCTLVFLYRSYQWGKWNNRPDIRRLKEICTSDEYRPYPEVVKEWIIDECIESVEWNSKPLSDKVDNANWALRASTIQGGFLVVSYLLYVLM